MSDTLGDNNLLFFLFSEGPSRIQHRGGLVTGRCRFVSPVLDAGQEEVGVGPLGEYYKKYGKFRNYKESGNKLPIILPPSGIYNQHSLVCFLVVFFLSACHESVTIPYICICIRISLFIKNSPFSVVTWLSHNLLNWFPTGHLGTLWLLMNTLHLKELCSYSHHFIWMSSLLLKHFWQRDLSSLPGHPFSYS